MKTIWILPGGGSYCAYTAGNLLALQKLEIELPDIIIASSGSAATASYFLAGQYSSVRNTWTECVPSKKFANPFRFWKMVNVDYLIDVVVKQKEPLDLKKLFASKTKLLIPMTNSDTGEFRYFSKEDNVDFFEILRGAKSAPVFSGLFPKNKFKYKGQKYLDTRVSSRPKQNIKKAIDLGADRIIVFDNYHPDSSRMSGEALYKLALYGKNQKVRSLHKKLMEEEVKVPKDIEFLCLKPKHPLNIWAASNNKEKIASALEYGFKEMYKNKELKNFYKST